MNDDEQAVLVDLGEWVVRDGDHLAAVATLESRLADLLYRSGCGEFDGNEFGPNGIRLFMYGPNARRMYLVIEPVLATDPLSRGARVLIRPGGPEVPGDVVLLPG